MLWKNAQFFIWVIFSSPPQRNRHTFSRPSRGQQTESFKRKNKQIPLFSTFLPKKSPLFFIPLQNTLFLFFFSSSRGGNSLWFGVSNKQLFCLKHKEKVLNIFRKAWFQYVRQSIVLISIWSHKLANLYAWYVRFKRTNNSEKQPIFICVFLCLFTHDCKVSFFVWQWQHSVLFSGEKMRLCFWLFQCRKKRSVNKAPLARQNPTETGNFLYTGIFHLWVVVVLQHFSLFAFTNVGTKEWVRNLRVSMSESFSVVENSNSLTFCLSDYSKLNWERRNQK